MWRCRIGFGRPDPPVMIIEARRTRLPGRATVTVIYVTLANLQSCTIGQLHNWRRRPTMSDDEEEEGPPPPSAPPPPPPGHDKNDTPQPRHHRPQQVHHHHHHHQRGGGGGGRPNGQWDGGRQLGPSLLGGKQGGCEQLLRAVWGPCCPLLRDHGPPPAPPAPPAPPTTGLEKFAATNTTAPAPLNMDRAGPHALVVTGAVGEGDGVYRTDSTFNGKARYVHESNPRQEILWIQLEVMHQRRPEHRTCWHITTDRKHPTDGAWTYESVPESNPERPATRLGAWKVEEWPRGMPTVESKELPAGEHTPCLPSRGPYSSTYLPCGCSLPLTRPC